MLLELALALTLDVYVIRSENMLPRLAPGQRVEIDLTAYASRAPDIGHIVLLHPPTGASTNECGDEPLRPGAACAIPSGGADTTVTYISRIVAVGGDRISLRRGRVIRNGKRETRKNLRRCPRDAGCTFPRTITVPAGHVYVAGDNRGASDDSRFWGAVPVSQVLGRYVRPARR